MLTTPQDPDVTTTYQNYFLVEFTDSTALEQIPAKGTNLKVEIPILRHQPGGISLTDLSGLLQSQERDWTLDGTGLYGATIPVLPHEGEQETQPTRVVELVVQHASACSLPYSSAPIAFLTLPPRSRLRARGAEQV